MGLLQCLFHMPHIVPRMVTVVEEYNDRLNVFHTLLIPVVLEPHAVTDVAAEVEVPLEKLPPKVGVQPGGRTLAIVTLTLLCPQRVASVTLRANSSAWFAGSTHHRPLHSSSLFSAARKAA